MKKFKFNFKLTLFLVGLFISFLLIFLSGKFEICCSIGLICLGISLILYIYFYSDSVNKALKRIQRKITKLEDGDTESFQEDYEDELEEDEQEDIEDLTQEEIEYMLMQLHLKKKKITKSNKKIKILFALSGGALVIAGFLLFI